MTGHEDEPPSTLSKAARNERIKLLANTFNTIGLAAFGLGVLTPTLTGSLSVGATFRIIAGTAILWGLHVVARWLLRELKD